MGTPSSSTDVVKTTLTSNSAINSLLDGYHWASSSITYSFIVPGSSYFSTNYPDKNFWTATQGFNTIQQTATVNALSVWSNVANLTFINVPDDQSSAGTIRLGFSSSHSWGNAAGATYFPNSDPSGGDLFLNPAANDIFQGYSNGTFSNSNFSLGSYAYFSLIHELGHALGLKHPFENSTDGGGASIDGTSFSSWDSRVFTVMSYTTLATLSDAIGFTYNPTTPMVLDIQAIQAIYGANYSYNSGNNNYTFNDNSGQYYFQTIWDGGGVNTITYTGNTSSTIDLRQGYGSKIGNAVYAYTAANSHAYSVNNLWIAYGTYIDNFIGEGGATLTIQCNDYGDTITCNSGNDTVTLGAGNDKVYVGQGTDTINGGKGLGTVIYNAPSGNYSIVTTNGVTTITNKNGGQGIDTLSSITYVQFTDKTINLLQSSTSTSTSPTYSLSSNSSSVTEGNTATFTLSTTNVASGTSVSYTLSGVSSSDIVGGQLSGSVTVGLNGQATISIPTIAHNQGNETLTVNVNGVTASESLLAASSSSSSFSSQYTNYLVTPLYGGKNGAFSGLTVKDNVGNSGTANISPSVQYITFNSGQTSVTVQNLTSSSVTLSGDANVIAVDPTPSASITGGSGVDVIFGGPNDKIYGGKGISTAAFVAPYSYFKITPLYAGKNGAFSGFSITDNVGSFGTTTVDSAVKYLSFGGSGNGATLLTLSSSGTFAVSGGSSTSTTSQGSVSTFLANTSSLTASSFSINDTNTNIASSIDSLQQNISKIKSIAITSSATSLPITYTQYANDSSVLADITGTYTLAVSGVIIGNLLSTLNNSKVTSLTVTDTSANISSNLDQLESNISKITSISQTDLSTPISVTSTQFTNDSKAISLINGAYSLNVTAVSISSFSSTIANNSVNTVSITDTDANFVANLSNLNANVSKISSITLTDSHVLAITAAQQTADSALLSKIIGGYTVATNTVTLNPSGIYTAFTGQTINGVSGVNTVVLTEPYANFSNSISGATDIIKDNFGTLGTITLNNIQRVKFSDGSELALDFQIGQNSFNAAMMIGTAFGANLVSTYFSAALSLYDQGQTNSQIATLIEQIRLIENQLGIANDNSASSNKAWVDFVYKNVVGSLPDPLSEAVFTQYLANGTYSRAQILTLAANAADASSGTIASQINLTGLQSKGLLFHSAF